MPPKTSTTRLPKSVLEELGLSGGNLKSSAKFSASTGGRSARSSRDGKPLGRRGRRRQECVVKRPQHQQRGVSRASGPPVSPSPSPLPPAPIIRRKRKESGAKEREGKEEKHSEPALKSILKKPKQARKANDEEEGEVWEPKPTLRRAVREKLEQDDMEIEYLEKKLKIKGKLPKAFQEDGLDFLFEGLEGIDRDEAVKSASNKRARPGLRKSAHQREESGEDEESSDEDGDVECMDEDMSDVEGDEGEDEFMGIGSDIEVDQEAEDSGSPKNGVSAIPSTPKYLPPSLRKTQATEPEKLARLRRKCHGLLNRLSEANLTPILSEVEGLYATNPRGDVTSTLSALLITIVGDQSALSDTFMILHAGFVAGIYRIMGTGFGAHIIQAVIEDFDGYYSKVNGIDDPASAGKKCTNLMSFISELYSFQVVGAVLIFDLLRIFLADITELNTELLLKVTRSMIWHSRVPELTKLIWLDCGHQLRQDDPTSLKDLVIMMQPAIAKIGYENLGIRTRFMIETLTNLKNNRLKSAAANSVVVAEATIRMKKLLGALNKRQIRASEPLRVSLADIKNTDAEGKWWLVGASWIGNQASTPTSTTSGLPSKAPKKCEKDPEDLDFYSNTDLLQLAREQRMNTDIRQAIFVAIMSAEDYTDAYFRILKLRLKRKQEPEIPRVLIHCCGSEASYNPYYALVARKLCTQSNLRMAFTFSLWGVFRRMGEGEAGGEEADLFGEDGESDGGLDIRKILNLSRMYGTLVAQDALGLDILKILDIAYLQDKTKTFLELMFVTAFLQTLGQESGTEESLKRVLVKIKENPALVRGVLFFLKKHVKGTDVVTDKAEEAAVARGVRFSSRLLESFVAKETLGE
ncbi:hypothetical protein C7212DRAFT_340240 [Tuber magnatum]|uniref:MI domain-containing protein n=1 Tax=Tuber magnatum TaxID=42249 RepID=A0A317SYE6_9PEZI|nr:hypothetical protein C7212DRAFT_340240 [Tuber magnatum]